MTQSWIVTAFNRMVMSEPFEQLGVVDIAKRAGVGRSTFYEHFRDKNELFRQAVTPVLAPLAESAVGLGDPARVRWVLEHIAANRPRCRAMLDSPARSEIEHALAELILERLAPVDGNPPSARDRLDAARLAGAHIALLRAWLDEHHPLGAAMEASELILKSRIDRTGA